MAPSAPEARSLARRLLSSAGVAPRSGGQGDAAVVLAGVSRVGERLAADLSRWFGAYGYHALLTRALRQAQAAHATLEQVRVSALPAAWLVGVEDAARTHGTAAAIEAVEAVLATLVALLGRLIGDDLTATLLHHTILALGPDAEEAADAADPSMPPSVEDVP